MSQTNSRFRILLAACMVLTAGCAGIGFDSDAPSKQHKPVSFFANNTMDSPHTFEVFVVDLPANLTTRRNDGLTSDGEIGEGTGTASPGDGYYFTEVEPDPELSRHYENITLAAGETTERKIENLPVGFAIVVVVYNEDKQITGYVTSNCDDLDLLVLDVEVYSTGVSTGHWCG